MRLSPLLLLGMLAVVLTGANEAQAAFGAGGATCTISNKTAGTTTLQCTVATQNLDAGNIAVLWFAGNELATATTADHNNLLLTSVTDSGSNIWTVQRCFTNTQTTGAADGATTCIATSKLTTTLTSGSGTITATFAAITAKAMVVREFTVGAGNTIAVVGTPQDLANDPPQDPGAMTISGLANSEHLFVRSTALERANATWTVTAGHTLATCNGTGGGPAPTNMNICGEFRILTATADTSNPTATAVDSASIFIAFNEVPATTLSDGTDPGNTTLAPGAGATLAGEFRFQNSSGSDVISSVVVGLGTGAAAGLSLVEIVDTTSPTPVVYGSVVDPATDTPTITLSTNTLTATTTLTTYRIRITPKTHPNMAPPATGVNHLVTAKINSWIGSGTHGPAGSDTAGTTITVDNQSPGNVTSQPSAAGNAQVVLNWNNPADTDLSSIVVLRSTAAVVATPVEGTIYVVGNTIGASTVACVVAAPATTCTDTGLTNGTAYHYRIFTQDSNGNYSNGGIVPAGSPFTPSLGRFAVATGNWSATSTWSSTGCGGAAGATVPVAGNDVTICLIGTPITVTLDTNSASLGSLTIEPTATLRFGNSNTARTLTVTGNITNAGTFNVNTASNTTHALVVGGDISNSGTINLATDAGSLCNTTFNKNGSQTVSGAGATTRFNRMTLNMGTSNANILEITATNFSINPAAPTNFLILTNGTFKFSTTGTITPFTAAPAISATRGFWLNNAGATVSSGNFDWTVTGTSDTARGLVRVSAGTFNLGTASVNNDLITGNFSDIVFEGGAINVGGVLRRAAVGNDVRFNMSGGTLTVAAAGAPGSYPFQMEAAASFTMSGGTIVIRNDGANNGYQNLATTNNVTGGTLQIGDGSTIAGQIMRINSTAPVGNLLINSANATARLQTNSLTVNGDVTIAAGIFDNPNNLNLTLGGNWSRTGTFTPGTGTVTFNGSAAQTITGVTTFNNLVIANASGVTANNNLTMNAGFTVNASAVFNAGSVTHDINGNFTNNGTFTADTSTVIFSGTIDQALTGTTTFNNLTLNNNNGSGTELTLNNNVTVNNTLAFTQGAIVTGANTLIIGNTSGCGVTGAAANRHVVGNLRKNFVTTTLTNCQFEIGDGVNYLPVTVAFDNVTGNGNLTVSTTASDHPDINTSGIDPNDNINRYWTLTRGGGLLFDSYTVTLNYLDPADYDVTPATAPDTAQRFKSSSWSNLSFFGSPTTTQAVLSGVTDDGDFALGKSSVAGVVREKEFIYTRELFY